MHIEEIYKIYGMKQTVQQTEKEERTEERQKEDFAFLQKIFHRQPVKDENEEDVYSLGEMHGYVVSRHSAVDGRGRDTEKITLALFGSDYEEYQVKEERGIPGDLEGCRAQDLLRLTLKYNRKSGQLYSISPALEEKAVSLFDLLLRKLQGQGYICNPKVLAQFLCAMRTNQIIILHGAPGMGKTSLVMQLAKAINAEYRMIPVRPNWIDGQDLIGFFNPVERRYYSTPFLDAMCEAREDPEKLFFLCLDEMNLAHVEYYFSDILSAMESDHKIPLYASQARDEALERLAFLEKSPAYGTDSLEYFEAKKNCELLTNRYTPDFEIPENVVFVGTLNMDGTTNDLSPKVIDRSCIIKVTRDTQSGLRDVTQVAFASPDGKEEKVFEEKLLQVLGKEVSKRVQKQKMEMNKWRKGGVLNGKLSDLDFEDFYLATKVLPALTAENIEIDRGENQDQLILQGKGQTFEILGTDQHWEEKYPLTVSYLKSMCIEEEGVINYWRMR